MTAGFNTACLRYRDLVTNPGRALRAHEDIIKTRGATWWAWWNKAHERVPMRAFETIREASSQGGFKCFLLDSGTRRLACAQLTDVRWGEEDSQIASPNPDLTPAYYRDQRFLAWFKFSSIVEENPNAVTAFEYVVTSELFRAEGEPFMRLDHAGVPGIDSLIQQNTTIWFFAPKSPSALYAHPDPSLNPLRIHLCYPKQVQPVARLYRDLLKEDWNHITADWDIGPLEKWDPTLKYWISIADIAAVLLVKNIKKKSYLYSSEIPEIGHRIGTTLSTAETAPRFAVVPVRLETGAPIPQAIAAFNAIDCHQLDALKTRLREHARQVGRAS